MTAILNNNMTARAATREDAQAVVDLMNASDLDVMGFEDSSLEDLLADWGAPDLSLEDRTQLVLTADDKIVGYEIIHEISPEDGEIGLDGYVHPKYNNQGIGTYLLQWSEARAKTYLDRFPVEMPVKVNLHVMGSDELSRQLLLTEGYHTIRHFYRMEIELQEAPPAPELSDGITIRTFVQGQDERVMYETITDSFMDHWGFTPQPFEEWVREKIERESFDPTLWFLAMDGDQVAGGATCLFRNENGWVRSLGVRRPWRRKGVGMALLRHAFGEFYKRGMPKIGLGVDAASLTGATRLYERAGMHVSNRFDRYEKVIREGQPIAENH